MRSIQLFGVSKYSDLCKSIYTDPRYLWPGAEPLWGGREFGGLLYYLAPLKPDRDSTTNRPSTIPDEGQYLAVLIARLCVQ